MQNLWSEEQVTVVLYEYCRRPFGQFSARKPFLIELGNIIGRSPGAIVRKVGNLASFDPIMKERGVFGLSHTAKIDEQVWNKYYGKWDQLVFDAEQILAKLRSLEFEKSLTIDLSDIPIGAERLSIVKQRINQDFFRRTVLTSYKQTCCITGINNPSLLEASHILDWSKDESERTNPENGLCLNSLFHKAYDSNLIGINPDFEIQISKNFFVKNPDNKTYEYIMSFNKKKITLPDRFLPNQDFLEARYKRFCETQ